MRLLPILFFLLPVLCHSQFTLSGEVRSTDDEILAGATIHVVDTYMATASNAQGMYRLTGLAAGSYTIEVRYIGFETQEKVVEVVGEDLQVDFEMTPSIINAQEVVVKASRASESDPIAYTELTKMDLVDRNLGMDVPEVLNTAPSLYFTSDAGNGIGYTYLRLRGNDQTNINVTINGVPLNDAESQGVFWVDLPDLIASTNNIQIQRGVGTSTNGAGAFGGSINLLTSGSETEPYGMIDLGGGSFNTAKFSVGFGTGLLNEHFSLQGRISSISSDGYMDRSAAELRSYFLSGGYQDERTSVRAMIFGGDEVTQQAWWGVPRARLDNDEAGMQAFAADNGWSEANTQNLLDSNRRFNYYTYDNEVDDYGQDHYQLHVSRRTSSHLSINGALHYTKGQGFFEQYQDMDNAYDDTSFDDYGITDPVIGGDTISSADFIRRRWLDNDFYGFIASATYTEGPWSIVIGGGANRYDGLHYGELIWASVAGDSFIRDRYYENDAVKDDANIYTKVRWEMNEAWSTYVDLQGRFIDYSFQGLLSDATSADQSVGYRFFNPKAGLNWRPSTAHRAFISFGVGNKEPNRDDHVLSTPNDRPRAQTLFDTEIGYAYSSQKISFEAVLYNMQYQDQLINTGEINDVGENVRTNVADSYRRGVELIFKARPIERFEVDLNLGLSQNVIQDHVEFVTDFLDYSLVEQDLGDVTIAYSPSVIASGQLAYDLFRKTDDKSGLRINLISKYVGEQYLDNTETEGRTIDAFWVNDIRLDLDLNPQWAKNIRLNLLVRNILDEEYVSNGWTYRYLYAGEEVSFDALFPQAGVNFMTGLTVEF
ncbi:MAG: TonB-dependent receptor [Flavobacteriales bacterium]|nr:TonB-dependent receptor [Flavobacteriales bacterium]